MKRKKFFSALMALAMILSLCTFASAGTATPAPVALAPGSAVIGTTSTVADMVEDTHLTVSGIGNEANQTVPAELAKATITYAVTVAVAAGTGGAADTRTASPASGQTMSITLKGANAASSAYSVAVQSSDTLDLAGTTAAHIDISTTADSTVVATFTVTPDGKSPLVAAAADGAVLHGVITLGGAGAFRPDVADSDGQTNHLNVQDSATGDVVSEGPLPDAVINVKVPTDAQTNHAFDLYLDPHDLIKDSAASRYAADGSSINLTGDSRLYFKNSATAMSNESTPLKIVNKSSAPVNVELKVEATKTNSTDFTFVNSADSVDSATGAAIYLAIKSSTVPEQPVAVSDTADTTSGKYTANLKTSLQSGGDKWYDLVWHGDRKLGYYSYDMNSTYATYATSNDDDKFESLTFQLTGKINDNDAWTPAGGNGVTFGLSVIWAIQKYEPDPGATVATAFTGSNSTLTLNLEFGEGANAKAKADVTVNNETRTIEPVSGGHTNTFQYKFIGNGVAYSNLDDSATVVFYNGASPAADSDPKTINLTGIKAAS